MLQPRINSLAQFDPNQFLPQPFDPMHMVNPEGAIGANGINRLGAQPPPINGQQFGPGRLQNLTSNTPALDQYSNYVNHPPNPNDFKVGKLGRLAAIIGGGSEGLQNGAYAGIKTAQDTLDRPYAKAMSIYTGKGKGLAEAANIEEKKNTNQRLAENEAWKNVIAEGKEKSEQNVREAQSAYYGARTTALTHPDWKVTKANGRVMMVNPLDPSQKADLGDANIISDAALKQQVDKYKQENGIKVGGEKELEKTKQEGRIALEDEKATRLAKDSKISASQYRIAHGQAIQNVLGDPANAGGFKNIAEFDKDTKAYHLKPIDENTSSNDLSAHELLISKIKAETEKILGRKPGDNTLPGEKPKDEFKIELEK